jgi:hypothetical protein
MIEKLKSSTCPSGANLTMQRFLAGVTCVFALLPTLASCEDNKPVMLGITSYNYTDRYIDSFFVGGQGGGDVELSTDISGGGKTSCCIGYNPRRPLPVQMKVEWNWGRVEDASGKVIKVMEHAETTSELRGPVPENPRFLEVHFMPDRTVQLRITAESSNPMLIIDRSGQKP